MPVSDRQEKGDVIYRQDAISVLGAQCKDEYNKTCGEHCECMEYIALRDIPSAQKKGHWTFKPIFPNDTSEFPMGYLECSECGSKHANATPCNFCDNCGADMRGEGNEDT